MNVKSFELVQKYLSQRVWEPIRNLLNVSVKSMYGVLSFVVRWRYTLHDTGLHNYILTIYYTNIKYSPFLIRLPPLRYYYWMTHFTANFDFQVRHNPQNILSTIQHLNYIFQTVSWYYDYDIKSWKTSFFINTLKDWKYFYIRCNIKTNLGIRTKYSGCTI